MGLVGGLQYPYKPRDGVAPAAQQKPEVVASMAHQIQHIEDVVRTVQERVEYLVSLMEGQQQPLGKRPAPDLLAIPRTTQAVDTPMQVQSRYYA